MADEKLLLKGKAKNLGIEGYRRMSLDELRVAVEDAQARRDREDEFESAGNGKPTKGAATRAVKGAKGAAKGVAKGRSAQEIAGDEAHSPGSDSAMKGKVSAAPAKGTTAAKTTTSPATKSKTQKSSPTKGTAAKGAAKRTGATKGKGSATPASKGARKPASRRADVKRAPLDVSKIDWDAETNVGKDGKRKVVLDALKKHARRIGALKRTELTTETLYPAVFEEVKEHAREWYPNAKNAYPHLSPTAAAEKMLRWLIGRVAFDFAYKSGQHVQGKREWKNPTHPSGGANARRTTARPKPAPKAPKGAAAKPQKGTGAAEKAQAAPRAAKGAAGPQKGAQRATGRPARSQRPQPRPKPAPRVPGRKALASKG